MAVGRQWQQAQVGRPPRIVGLEMETGLVGYDDVAGLRVDFGDLTQEKRVGVLIDRRGEEQLHAIVSIHFNGFVQVAPFVFGGLGHIDAHSAQTLEAADNVHPHATPKALRDPTDCSWLTCIGLNPP